MQRCCTGDIHLSRQRLQQLGFIPTWNAICLRPPSVLFPETRSKQAFSQPYQGEDQRPQSVARSTRPGDESHPMGRIWLVRAVIRVYTSNNSALCGCLEGLSGSKIASHGPAGLLRAAHVSTAYVRKFLDWRGCTVFWGFGRMAYLGMRVPRQKALQDTCIGIPQGDLLWRPYQAADQALPSIP